MFNDVTTRLTRSEGHELVFDQIYLFQGIFNVDLEYARKYGKFYG